MKNLMPKSMKSSGGTRRHRICMYVHQTSLSSTDLQKHVLPIKHKEASPSWPHSGTPLLSDHTRSLQLISVVRPPALLSGILFSTTSTPVMLRPCTRIPGNEHTDGLAKNSLPIASSASSASVGLIGPCQKTHV